MYLQLTVGEVRNERMLSTVKNCNLTAIRTPQTLPHHGLRPSEFSFTSPYVAMRLQLPKSSLTSRYALRLPLSPEWMQRSLRFSVKVAARLHVEHLRCSLRGVFTADSMISITKVTLIAIEYHKEAWTLETLLLIFSGVLVR